MRKKELPHLVRKAIERLRREKNAYIEAKYRKGRYYYAFEATSKFDKDRKKPRKITSYMGRISTDGEFLPAMHRTPSGFMNYITHFMPKQALGELERIKGTYRDAYIARIEEGKFYVYSSPTEVPPKFLGIISEDGLFTAAGTESMPLSKEPHITTEEAILLTGLSMNARMPLSLLSKLSGLPEQTAYSKVKSLEKKFGIRYLLDVDVIKLGYSPFMVLVKFENPAPTLNVLKDLFIEEPNIQLVATTKGYYDMILYIIAENTSAVSNIIWNIRSKGVGKNYRATWYISPFELTYGLVPMRDVFFDSVLKAREPRRSKQSAEDNAEKGGLLLKRELAVLRELNRDSTAEFTKIDKDLGLNSGSSQYTYYKLKERGIINATITMDKLPMHYPGIILVIFTNAAEYVDTRHEFFSDIIKYRGISNKYSLIGDIGVPNGALLIMPVFEANDLDVTTEYINTRVKGISTSAMVVTNILMGSICYRRFDNDYSRQYAHLEQEGFAEQKTKVGYD